MKRTTKNILLLFVITFIGSCKFDSDTTVNSNSFFSQGMSKMTKEKPDDSCIDYKRLYKSNKVDSDLHLIQIKDHLEVALIDSLKVYDCDKTSVAKISSKNMYVNGYYLDSIFSIDSMNSDLLLRSVLCHEVSHFLYNHDEQKLRPTYDSECYLIRKRELEADYFTGVMLHELDTIKNISNSTYYLDIVLRNRKPMCYPELKLRKEYAQLGYEHGMKYDITTSKIDTYQELKVVGNSIPVIGKDYPDVWGDTEILILIKLYKKEIEDLINNDKISKELIDIMKSQLDDGEREQLEKINSDLLEQRSEDIDFEEFQNIDSINDEIKNILKKKKDEEAIKRSDKIE